MKVENLVPEVYYKNSRDFSFIGRLFEVVLNYMRLGSNIVGSDLNHSDLNSNILELLCNTLGFIPKHKYNMNDLVHLASVFSTLLKNKGNIESFELAIKILVNNQKVNDYFQIEPDENDPNKLKITLPDSLEDIILLEDIFDYILPVGMEYSFAFTSSKDISNTVEFETHSNKINIYQTTEDDYHLGNIYRNNEMINQLDFDNEKDLSLTYLGTVIGSPLTNSQETNNENQES